MLQTDKNGHTDQSGKGALVAGVAGLLVGASVTALALSDEETRKRLGKKAKKLKSTLQDWSADKLQMVDHKTVKEDTVKKTEKVVDKANEDEPLKNEVTMHN